MPYENTSIAGSLELSWQGYPLGSPIDHTVHTLSTITPADAPLPADGFPFLSGQTMMPPVPLYDAARAPAHYAQLLPPGLGWPHAPVNQAYYNWIPQVPQNMPLNVALPQDAEYDLQLASMNSDFQLQELTPETAAYLSAFVPVEEADYFPPSNDLVVDLILAPLSQEYGPAVLVNSKPISGLPLADLSLEKDSFTQIMGLKPSGPLELPQNQADPAPSGVDQVDVLQNPEPPVVVPAPQPNMPRTSSVTRTSRKKPNKSVPYQRHALRLPQVQTGTGSGNSTPSPITSGSSIVPQRYKHVPSPGSESSGESDTRMLFPVNWETVIEQQLNTAFLMQPPSLPHLGNPTITPPQEYRNHICTYINPHSGEGCWTKIIQGHPSEWLRKCTNGKRGYKGFFGRHEAEILRHMAWHRYQELKPLIVRVPCFDLEGAHPTTPLQSSTPQFLLTQWSHTAIDHQLMEDSARPDEQTWCKGEKRLSAEELREWLSVSPFFGN